jgi:putative peptidoglycan lipid II flippase
LARIFTKNRQDEGNGEFINAISTTFVSIIFWSLPISVLFITLRAQIIRVVLGAGEFNWTDTRLAAAALALFAISAAAQGLILLFTRAFYAAGHTARPLFANVSAGIVTIALGYGFTALFTASPSFKFFIESILRVSDVSGTAVLALPLAYTIGSFLNLFILWFSFSRNCGGLWKIIKRPLWESIAASIIAGTVSYIGLNIFDSFLNLQKIAGVFLHGFLAGILGIAAWAFVLYLLKNRELTAAWTTIHHKIWRAKAVSPDPADNPTI